MGNLKRLNRVIWIFIHQIHLQYWREDPTSNITLWYTSHTIHHLFSTYLSSICNEPGAELFIGDTKIDKSSVLPAHTEYTFQWGQLGGSNIKRQHIFQRNEPKPNYAYQIDNN